MTQTYRNCRKRGKRNEWYPETVSYDREDLCFELILPIVPKSGSIFLPLEYLGVMERVGFQNFVEDDTCLEERNCSVLLLLLEKPFFVFDI